MTIDIRQEPFTALEEYAGISIAFDVRSVYDVVESSARIILTERRLDRPWRKDYDAIDGEGPTRWREQFDLSNWGLFLARLDGRPVGGAAVAFDTPGVNMLEGRRDLAVLWDIRVSTDVRGHHVGSRLFQAAENWAWERRCAELKIETQNINVAACRFYTSQGCELRRVDRFAYRELPDEVQLLWYKDLRDSDARQEVATFTNYPQ